jgi:uncharacterized protein YbjT (DUF2867 family)
MKIILTGSLGHISKPLTVELVEKGHQVTVVSSKDARRKDIEALGARAAIGSIEDPSFLTRTFTGADAAYLMEPPPNFFDRRLDLHSYVTKVAHGFEQAIRKSGIQRVVHLSSIGAHTDKGNGMLSVHYKIEQIMGKLPAEIAIVFLRPVGFYYNLLSFIPAIKDQGAIVSNYGGDDKEPWVSPIDIAAAAAKAITEPFTGRTVQYLASDELSPNEVAAILGAAIGRPGLQWKVIPDEQLLNGMVTAGMNPEIARGLVEMNASRRGGILYQDYDHHRPVLGRVKMTEFAKEFAAAFAAPNVQLTH